MFSLFLLNNRDKLQFLSALTKISEQNKAELKQIQNKITHSTSLSYYFISSVF